MKLGTVPKKGHYFSLAGITQQRHWAQHVLGSSFEHWTPVPGTQSERSLRILGIRACICVHYNYSNIKRQTNTVIEVHQKLFFFKYEIE